MQLLDTLNAYPERSTDQHEEFQMCLNMSCGAFCLTVKHRFDFVSNPAKGEWAPPPLGVNRLPGARTGVKASEGAGVGSQLPPPRHF